MEEYIIYFGIKERHNLLWNGRATLLTLEWRSSILYFGIEGCRINFGIKERHNLLWNGEATKLALKWRSYIIYFGIKERHNLLWNGRVHN